MSQLEVDKVIPQSGTTLTLGESGDTVSVPSGATLDASNATLTLPDDSVTTAKIDDGAVTSAKITYPLTTFSSTGIDDDGTSTAITINSSNNVALAGNIGLGGATPTTSGTGITFPATASPSTNANTLDDYEEGTWTPEYAPFSGDPFTLITYNFRDATYTKIGRQVTCLLSMRTSALTKGTASGSVNLIGLPFTVGSSANQRSYYPLGVSVSWTNNPSNIRPNQSTTAAIIQKTFSNASLQVADMGTGVNNNFMGLEFTYFID